MSETALNEERPAPSGKASRAAILGAMFLMATSAIGPGFITQTTTFTAKLGAAFAFAVLASTLVDVAVQLNVWRVVGISGMRVGEIGNTVLPGLGWALAALVVLGGLVFNIGNIGGAGLGTSAMLGMNVKLGGALSAALAIAIFLSKKAGVALDRIVVVLGAGMIVLTGYVAIVSKPPRVSTWARPSWGVPKTAPSKRSGVCTWCPPAAICSAQLSARSPSTIATAVPKSSAEPVSTPSRWQRLAWTWSAGRPRRMGEWSITSSCMSAAAWTSSIATP